MSFQEYTQMFYQPSIKKRKLFVKINVMHFHSSPCHWSVQKISSEGGDMHRTNSVSSTHTTVGNISTAHYEVQKSEECP